jgi:HK97 family phage major capsid protein
MSQVTQKALQDKALQCISLARTIRDRWPDPTKIPAEDAAKMSTLLTEATRLKGLAALEHEQDQMESWGREPDRIPSALAAEAAVAAGQASKDGVVGSGYEEAMKRRKVELFAKAIRQGVKGQQWVDGLDTAEKAALIEDATGEIIVPHDLAGPIFKTLPHLGVFRGSGPLIRQTTSNKVDIRSLTGATAGWGQLELTAPGTVDANVVPNTPVDVVQVHDLTAMSRIGVDELADTDANIVALVQDIVGQKTAEMEDDAFAAGNGVSKPWGLAARATSAANQITQAVTADTDSTPIGDGLKQLQYRVPSRFRRNGAYYASNDAAEAIALLKDANSNYLWQPSARAGEPDTLFGKRFYNLEGLPSMGASAAAVDPSVIFGDPNLGYVIADRQRITVQRLDERYAELGLVAFLFRMRVGGDVMRPAAFAKYLL